MTELPFRFTDQVEARILGIGMVFLGDDGEMYMLSQVGNGEVAMLGTPDCNRYQDPVKVRSAYAISQDEWYKIIDDMPKLRYVGMIKDLLTK